jgi:hypothetical protein
MFPTAYDTTLGQVFNTNEIRSALLKEVIIPNLGMRFDIEMGVSNNIRLVESGLDVPGFTQPYYLNNRGTEYVITDMRQFFNHGEITNTREWGLLNIRHILTSLFIAGNTSSLILECKLAGTVLSTLVSSTIVNKFSLTATDLTNIKILTAIYYGSLFKDPRKDLYDEHVKTRDVIRWTGINSKVIEPIIKNTGYLGDLPTFVKAIKSVVNNVRLRKLDSGLLVTALGNIIFGYNVKETITMALEHPPTWIGLVFMSLTDKSFNRTVLGKYVQQLEKRNSGDDLKTFIETSFKEL